MSFVRHQIIGAAETDFQAGREAGMADGAAAAVLASTKQLGGDFYVTKEWLATRRMHFDAKKSAEWQAGYNDGFAEMAPKLAFRKVSPDVPDEPFHPPPNTPYSLAAAAPSAPLWQWGLGIGVAVAGIYGISRAYHYHRTRTL